MSPQIYFIRHGQTDWNARHIIQGHTNTPLNDHGRSQARRNGQILAQHLNGSSNFEFVSSPLDRARETMEIVRQELGLPIDAYDMDERLMEVHYGDWQKHSWEELRKENSREIEARFTDPWGTVAPGGESYEQATARIVSWLEEITRNMVVVTHGGIMRCIRGHILNVATALRPSFDVPHDKVLLFGNGELHWI